MTDLQIPSERDMPAARLERRRDHLLSELATSESTQRRRKRRLVLILVPVAVLLLVATGFTTYVLTREPTHLETIGCFDREGNTAVVNADGRHPVEICRELWQRGDMGPNPPAQLAACVLPTGPVGVFPSSGRDTCGRLGYADLPPSYLDELARFTELRKAIRARFGTECIGENEARAIVREELDRHAYAGWDIEVGAGDGDGFSAERPCAEVSFDGGRKTVVLVPVWRD